MKHYIRYLPLAVFALPGYAFAAPAQPDAGQTLRNIEQMPAAPMPQQAPAVSLKNEQENKSTPGNDTVIPVTSIQFSGNTVYPDSELQPLVAGLVGKPTLAQLEAGAQRITSYYHAHGYIVARAYIPAQKIEGGIVTIKILEGIVGKQSLMNSSRLSDDRANAYLSHSVQPGDVLRSEPIDRSLLLLADTPGVGGAHTTLRPGASVGATDLLVTLDPAKAYSGGVSLNNYGNRYTGEYLADTNLSINSPLHIGDQLTLRGMTSDDHLLYGRAAYQIPVGYSGLRMGVSYADSGYHLGKEFKSLDATGGAGIASVFATYPLIRTLATNLYSTAAVEDKRLEDKTGASSTDSKKTVDDLNLGLSANHQDHFGGGGVTAVELGVIHGRLSMDATSLGIDQSSARTDGDFTRFTYNINRLQMLTQNNFFSAAVSGQQASKNLGSSEEISLGGPGGVRAYPANEADGDQGWVSNLELRHNFPTTSFFPQVQGIMFYDIGSVDINHSNYSTDSNTRTISGAGIGANLTTVGNIQFTSYLAWRTSGGDPTTEPHDRSPMLWLQMSKNF